jgi:hypothetical protein
MKIFFDLPKISSNQIYSGMHWKKRNDLAKRYHNEIWYLVKKNNLPKIKKKCKIIFGFMNSFDTDNNFFMVKMVIDGIKYSGILIDDSRKYVKCVEVNVSDSNWFEVIEL